MSRRPTETDGIIWDKLVGYDKAFEHRTRLGICVLLARNDSLTFSRFKALFHETDGALGAHLRRLEDEGYIVVNKQFQMRRPTSWYTLTPSGRKALSGHLKALEKLIAETDI